MATAPCSGSARIVCVAAQLVELGGWRPFPIALRARPEGGAVGVRGFALHRERVLPAQRKLHDAPAVVGIHFERIVGEGQAIVVGARDALDVHAVCSGAGCGRCCELCIAFGLRLGAGERARSSRGATEHQRRAERTRSGRPRAFTSQSAVSLLCSARTALRKSALIATRSASEPRLSAVGALDANEADRLWLDEAIVTLSRH
jgi:hypothetical protein